MDELIKELQALIEKYQDNDADPTEEDAERMAQLTDEINKRSADAAAARESRAARVEQARAAIANGTARRVDSMPVARSANGGCMPGVYDTTDYKAAERRAWVKGVAERCGVALVGGNELTEVERAAAARAMEARAAFSHLTGNTDSAVPVEIQNQIVSLIDNTAVLYGDISRQSFPHQFEILRHKSIKKGDAAKTDEAAAPTDDEQDDFDTVTLTGEEIKKTVKMSRKMAVQSVDGFEQYIVSETAARLSVACNAFSHERLVDETLGMAADHKIATSKALTLEKADLTKMLGKLRTYGNAAAKGCIIYANSNTIWNQIAMLEDANKRSYFINEKTDDPAVEGHIFGKLVKRDDSVADNVILAGYPDLIAGNLFSGPDVTPYVAQDGTQRRCFDGYVLFDCGLTVPQAFAQLTIKAS